MYIFDSNIWIYALTEQGENPYNWYSKVRDGRILVGLNSYIYLEVLHGFERSKAVKGRDVDEAQTNFINFVENCQYVTQPPREVIRDLEYNSHLDDIREQSYNTMFGDILNIQPKDAPVLQYAYECQDAGPTILTNDESFSNFNPEEYELSDITMEYVSVDLTKSPSEPLHRQS